MAQASNNDNSLACIVWPWIVVNWQRMNMDSMRGPFVLFYFPLHIILSLLWLCSTTALYCVQPCACYFIDVYLSAYITLMLHRRRD